jgi:hypothetical protein
LELKSLDDELGPSLHKLEKKLSRQGLEIKKRKGVELVPDKEFSEIIEKIILPIMSEYKKFLETKQENVYLNCAIETPYKLHESITFELKDSIQISKQDSVRRITFFPRKDRVHIFEEGTLGDGHPVELSYTKNEITEEFVRKKLTGLIKEYVDKLLTAFK